jgi:hypothetical protein
MPSWSTHSSTSFKFVIGNEKLNTIFQNEVQISRIYYIVLPFRYYKSKLRFTFKAYLFYRINLPLHCKFLYFKFNFEIKLTNILNQ